MLRVAVRCGEGKAGVDPEAGSEAQTHPSQVLARGSPIAASRSLRG
jgi:hypothetical protein